MCGAKVWAVAYRDSEPRVKYSPEGTKACIVLHTPALCRPVPCVVPGVCMVTIECRRLVPVLVSETTAACGSKVCDPEVLDSQFV